MPIRKHYQQHHFSTAVCRSERVERLPTIS
jgi:hypothetical protein